MIHGKRSSENRGDGFQTTFCFSWAMKPGQEQWIDGLIGFWGYGLPSSGAVFFAAYPFGQYAAFAAEDDG